jgi:uncharacterized membrane protein
MVLVVLNSFFSLVSYYRILYSDHRQALGFVVLGQALLVLALFHAWTRRVGKSNRTAEALLIIALALVTAAIPLHLKLYAIPIAWALEGALFVYVGIRFGLVITRVGGLAALGLAAWDLLHRLPLHRAVFTPLFNIPFGSWIVVIAATFVAAWLLARSRSEPAWLEPRLAGVAFVLGFGLACALLTLEVSGYWKHVYAGTRARAHEYSSLIVLWTLIPAGVTAALSRTGKLRLPWLILLHVCAAIAVLLFFAGFGRYSFSTRILMFNPVFIPRLLLPVGLWWMSRFLRCGKQVSPGLVFETGGHILLAILLAMEVARWSHHSSIFSGRMALSLVSAVWALQAFALIWLGLASRCKSRRILGFVLFGITVLKVLAIDMSELEKVYRILSFIASGLLLVGAAYFYQRYSPMLLGEMEEEDAGQ